MLIVPDVEIIFYNVTLLVPKEVSPEVKELQVIEPPFVIFLEFKFKFDPKTTDPVPAFKIKLFFQ